MALSGTIKDFALPDIFQLIGIQRKTGLLTLDNGENTVTLKFLDGQVVGADTKTESSEERLGEVLVRTGRISEAQLKEALRLQKNTLQRLGYILVNQGHISEENLVDALRLQSSQIIYRLFRWHEGTYHFDRVEDLEYDQKHFMPISSETILMEGARMIDEWPIIERRIRSDKMVLARTSAARELDLNVESILDEDIDFNFELDPPDDEPAAEKVDGKITLSPEEREIMSYVDGVRSVREICDLLTMGEFDIHRILSDMLTRNLVEEVRGAVEPRPSTGWAAVASRATSWLVHALVAALAASALLLIGANPATPWKLLASHPTSEKLRRYASMARMERIENAIQVFYLDAGSFPDSLPLLARHGLVKAGDLLDPWGRPYHFQIDGGGYQLSATNGEGMPRPELSVARRFNEAQRLMLSGADSSRDDP